MAKQLILVVEDEASLRQGLTDALTDAGYEVVQAGDGKAGLEAATKRHPDFILTDNLMPQMSGVEMITAIRKTEWGATVPIAMMTGVYDISALNQTLQSGSTDFVMKADMSMDSLLRLIEGHLAPKA